MVQAQPTSDNVTLTIDGANVTHSISAGNLTVAENITAASPTGLEDIPLW